MMELRVLHYFLTVAQEGNLSRAAKVLHVTQPTLSRQLADLESELGATLFLRGNRRITLTEQGQLLRRRAEEVVTLVERIEEEIHEPGDDVTGTISIGAAETSASEVLSKLLRAFSSKYPQVQYKLSTATADIIKERLDKGLVDIGLLIEPAEIGKYAYVRMEKQERWGVYTRSDSSLAAKEGVTIEDLQGLPLMLPWRPEVRDRIAAWFGKEEKELQVFGTYDLAYNVMPLVAQGLAHALALEYATQMIRDRDICFRPLVPEIYVGSALIWKQHQPASEAVRRFIQEITIQFGNR